MEPKVTVLLVSLLLTHEVCAQTPIGSASREEGAESRHRATPSENPTLQRTRQSNGATRIRWLPDCGAGAEHPFFSIEVRDDGLVRYEGYDGAKVLGSRESQIGAASARRLKAKVVSFVREHKALKDSQKQFEPRYFCLEASVLRGSEAAATYRQRSDVHRSRSLLREVRKRVGAEQWACPASSTSRGRLDASGYCSELPAVSLTLAGRTSCDLTQDLFVYEDGTVYSLVYRTHGRRDMTDRYYQMDPRAVDDLVASIRSLERAAMQVIDDPPGRTQTIYYRYKPEDVQAIKNRLESLAAIEWLNTSDGAGCEQFPGPTSMVYLRKDLDLPGAE